MSAIAIIKQVSIDARGYAEDGGVHKVETQRVAPMDKFIVHIFELLLDVG